MDIKIEDLEYTYMPGTPFEKTAISGINLEIKAGTFVGLIGHTGSGKSTLIQHLNGLLKPTKGKILVDGKNIADKDTDLKQLRFQVGLVFQYPEYQLFDETVEADIGFGPRNMKLEESEIKRRVTEAAKQVGISEELMKKSPFELSGGQKRRVAIAGVLAMDPQVLILDEPAAGLDPHGRDEILSTVKRLHKERGITVILVSHSMEDIANNASQVLVMNHGTIAMQGDVDEVFGRGQELEKMGLSVPQITRLVIELRNRGFDLPADIYTTQRAKEELLRCFKKG